MTTSISFITNCQRIRYRIAASSFYFIQGFAVTSWASRLPDIKLSLSLSDGSLGLLLLAPPAGQLAAMALSGCLVKRFGSFRIVRVAGLILPCWLPVLGMISAWPGLFAALFFFGMATNLSNISINTQCIGIEQIYGKSIMASFHGVWSLGGIGAILLSSCCAIRGLSPKTNFLFAAAVSVFIYLMNFRNLLPCDRQTEQQKKTVNFKELLSNKYLWILGIISLGCLGCEGVMNNWSSIYFQKIVNAELQYVRVGLFVYMLFLTCNRFTADWFIRKWGGENMIRLSGVLIICGMALLTSSPYVLPAAAGCALVGMGTSVIVPICYGLVGKYDSVPTATAITMVAGVGFIGFLVMPALVGGLSEWIGLKTALFLVGCFSFLTTWMIVFTRKKTSN